MSNSAIINLKRISKGIYSNYFASQTKTLENIPSFFNMWNYMEKFCDVVVLKDKKVLKDIEDLVKSTISFEGYIIYRPSDEFLNFEVSKLVVEALRSKYEEVLNIIDEAANIYNEDNEKFLDARTIKVLNSVPTDFETEEYYYNSSMHYEVFNLLFSLIFEFMGNGIDEEIINKALNYIYITSDTSMMKVLENKGITYKDFLDYFIYNNRKLNEDYSNTVRFIDLDNLPEMYKNVRLYG